MMDIAYSVLVLALLVSAAARQTGLLHISDG
nr:MAG TPA: hypothetical protein [Caudoviricetes sp.]